MKIGEKIKKFSSGCRNILRAALSNNWWLTIIFFFVSLALSLLVWWDCIYRPLPSQAVKDKITQEQLDFKSMNKKIESVIKKLHDKEERLKNLPQSTNARPLFIRKDDPLPAAPLPKVSASESNGNKESPKPGQPVQ